jgi:OPA family glycerol-3-phosphate transporter-like MFS transporter
MPAENAIFATVILAIFSMISYSLFDALHRKVFPNEIVCAAAIFGGAALCGAILYVINLFASTVITSMLLMALIVACTHGVNMMLISIVPKRFAKSGKVSTFSGLLNAGTYVGAAIATPVFALIAENYSWNTNVLVWGVLAAVGTAVCLAVMPLWKKFRRDYSDNPEV